MKLVIFTVVIYSNNTNRFPMNKKRTVPTNKGIQIPEDLSHLVRYYGLKHGKYSLKRSAIFLLEYAIASMRSPDNNDKTQFTQNY